MGEIKAEVSVAKSPEDAWAVVGDIGGIDKWLTTIQSVTVNGDVRECAIQGGVLKERILSRDDAARTYSYTMDDAPFPVDKYVATFAVQPEGDGSKITWSAEIEPDQMAQVMSGVFNQGLQSLKSYLEG